MSARALRARRCRAAALLRRCALLGAWELYVDLGGVEAVVLPAPHAVAAALWDNARRCSWRNFAVTAEEVVLGLALALAARLRAGRRDPPLAARCAAPSTRCAVGSQAVPIPVIGVLLVFWWGFGMFPKLVVIALICFFPVVVTTVDGLAAVDPDQLKLLRTLDASRWQAFRFAELPAALPAALSGARIALAVGVIGAFIAETSTPTHRRLPGPGARDHHRRQRFQTAARVRRHGACCSRSRSPASTPSRSPSAGSRRGAPTAEESTR